MSDFPSVAHSSIYCVDGWIIQGFLIIVHGQRPWTTSLLSIHGQCPWTTLLSSKGDLVSYNSHSRSVTFPSLLGWFLIQFALLDMDDPYGRIGDELIFRYPIKDYNYKFLYSKILLFRLFISILLCVILWYFCFYCDFV